ncbi:MAG TPA: RNA-binding cell elongation regulator Jag/EloR [Candidatus Atribacteria bacterium]|jgi:spoIIIJ-associated protein|nr:RNA-binding cell elongation regulator Jag/EloR [Candidatus Atribacteria bacterium]
MDFSEKWGKDVEDAVRLALQDLKVERDQVEVIVLEEPSRGFFGIGSKLAKVRVVKKKEPEIEKKEEEKEKRKIEEPSDKDRKEKTVKSGSRNKSRSRKKKSRQQHLRDESKNRVSISQRPPDLKEVDDAPAMDFLKDVISRMGLDLEVKAYANEECVYFEISGPDSGSIIGKRGQTLDSIQYLTSLVANKDRDKYLRVIVDAENYRSKREKTLEQLANRLADKVQRTGKNVRLEPMNPYERKVIHSALQKNAAVTTRSEGEEPYRRVIIERK